MARLEQLLEAVDDEKLRAELAAEVTSLKGRTRFGLVYERHLPETVVVGDVEGLKLGDHVRLRKEANGGPDYRVGDVKGNIATLLSLNGNGGPLDLPVSDLLVVKPFGEATYLGLTPLSATRRSKEKPYHAVIN